ncbi:NAD kinase [Cytophaga hutchinsonii]|uniref:NAD kinase n=1 Tax=Cytophaga hutchinsonii (strain ATCC 33406 / DSM 1761 / CIP 103989 / NBRC 15051 / NCIMB 9469 / D465) TaxID=269798 RepID=NADK_CYTH3|nr:NAD kinase [Cytophaga hutchinsonii]Q11PL9.1 RecName: Full=NAD kinase; AltName: Full=ATP-dependent NAD kinase [Cytophaga hutchinsonii ATCC 33406]ABG60644.1 NAD(+) kinase [Cytophaga hutchinsonii ATCC 33406]SFY01124.1 NAD+ kinase [Cytophaga hutchinsonii ATCC 33406]
MIFALHGRPFKEDNIPYVQHLLYYLQKKEIQFLINESFVDYLVQCNILLPSFFTTFTNKTDLGKPDLMLSIGGDGTLLESATFIGDQNIPLVGINTGRLGFLATTPREELEGSVDELISGSYKLSERTLIKLISDEKLFGDLNFAMNEFALTKRDSSSMITVHTYIDGEFLNSYWADGLLVSTPTGSTGYSLSCGGPLVHPKTENFIITPISPHNLNVRPMIVPDSCHISFEIEGRNQNFLISLDSRAEIVSSNIKLSVKKEDFKIQLVELKNYNYYKTLRSKLNWGLDARN